MSPNRMNTELRKRDWMSRRGCDFETGRPHDDGYYDVRMATVPTRISDRTFVDTNVLTYLFDDAEPFEALMARCAYIAARANSAAK